MRITDVAIQSGGLEAIKKVAGKKPVDKPAQAREKGDSVTLSESAKKLSSSNVEANSAAQRVEATPDVRMDRINDVKEKIANGYYDSDEFQDKLADRLLKEFGVNE